MNTTRPREVWTVPVTLKAGYSKMSISLENERSSFLITDWNRPNLIVQGWHTFWPHECTDFHLVHVWGAHAWKPRFFGRQVIKHF